MSTQLVKPEIAADIERVVVGGDLEALKPEQRLAYYKAVCDSVGLNPLTRPFEYIKLNGKLTLYARKDCTDQLRNIHGISVNIVAREVVDDCYVVTSRAKNPSGREDESIGAVTIGSLKGDAKCNAMMKAETKAKRRVTLSICGLGILDEMEIETIPSAKQPEPPPVSKTISFKRESAEVRNEPQVDATTEAAAVTTVEAVPVPAADTSTVEYISTGQAKNFHMECRKAVSERRKNDADNLIYQWLTDNHYLDENKEPSASMIRANEWPTPRQKAVAWLRVQ